MSQAGFLSSINWGVPSWDLFILLFFIVSVFVYGFALGRERILVVLVSIYIGFAVAAHLPYINENVSQKFGFGPVFVMRLVVFLVVMVALFFLFSRMNLFNGLGGKTNLPVVAVFSILHVGLFVCILLSFIPLTVLGQLSSVTKTIFTSEIGRFLWLIAPILAMYLVKGEEAE